MTLGKLWISLLFLGQLQVLKVIDGDTFWLRTADGFKVKARIVGPDCPEMSSTRGKKRAKAQVGAREATEELKKLLSGKIEVKSVGTDHFGRSLVEVLLADGRSVNEILINEGFCEAYRGKIQINENRYRDLEKQAKSQKKGIWGMKNYESPHLFRKRQMR